MRSVLTHPLPYGFLLSSVLLSGCILRVPQQSQNTTDTSTLGQSTVSSSALSSTGTQGTDSSISTSASSSALNTSSLGNTASESSGVGSSTSSSETSNSSDSSDSTIEPIIPLDRLLDRYAKNYHPSNELLRMRGEIVMDFKNKIVSNHSYLEKPGQRYAFGSITKTMTAVAILQLEQAGKLKRSDKLRKHIPELPASFDAITLKQLLTHRSGLGNYLLDEDALEFSKTGQTRKAMIARIAKQAPSFVPGSKSSYSNSGYYLLGIVIERSSKQSLDGYFQSYIFGPAKMKDSSLWDDNLSQGHSAHDGKMVLSQRSHPTVTFSAGGACGTSKDLVLFGRALRDGTLLPKTIFAEMIEPSGKIGELDHGMGLFSVKLSDGRRIIGHNGRTFGHVASWYMTIEGGVRNAVVLSNMQSVDTDQIAFDALKMAITGKYVEPPVEKKAMPFDPVIAKQMAGRYALDPAKLPDLEKIYPKDFLEQVKELRWSGDAKYLVKPVGQGEFEVKQVGKDEFEYAPGKIKLQAQRDGDRVKGLTLTQGGVVLPYLKTP